MRGAQSEGNPMRAAGQGHIPTNPPTGLQEEHRAGCPTFYAGRRLARPQAGRRNQQCEGRRPDRFFRLAKRAETRGWPREPSPWGGALGLTRDSCGVAKF
eukprot:2699248-Alexandrium_andersonii.AAC.1